MIINDQMVDELANLARLHFSAEEKIEIQQDLQRMIAFVEKLNEVNTAGIEPQLHMSSEINVLREDEVKGSITRDLALQNAPATDGIFFKVPKVIKK